MNANSHGPEHAGTFLLRRGSGRRLRSGQLARGRAGGRAFARAICPRLHTSTPRHTRVAVRCPIGAAYRLVLPRADTRACEVMVYANITETDQRWPGMHRHTTTGAQRTSLLALVVASAIVRAVGTLACEYMDRKRRGFAGRTQTGHRWHRK